MIIKKHFLIKKDYEKIRDTMGSSDFPWYYNDAVVLPNDQQVQFTHTFYRDHVVNSNFFEMLSPIFDKIKPLSILRVKANLLLKTPQIIEHGMHTDYRKPKSLTTAILYFDDSNGYTKFEKDNKIVKSEQNKYLEFNASLKHTGSSCTDKLRRIVLNINYLKE